MTTLTMQTRKANARAMMGLFNAPMTRDHLLMLAAKYERAYRRHRTCKRPDAPEQLVGELLTARAFYSLAREVR